MKKKEIWRGERGKERRKRGRKGEKREREERRKGGEKGQFPQICVYISPPQYLSLGESAKPKKNQKMEIWRGGVEKGNEAPGDHPCPSRNLGEMSLAEGREEGRKR